MQQKTIFLSGKELTPTEVREIAIFKCPVAIAESAIADIEASYNLVQEMARSGKPVYGISTGFGELSKVYISEENNSDLQKNLFRSHACAVGEPFDEITTRAIMLLRLNTLVKGKSGVTPGFIYLIRDLLNKNVLPVIPSQGSLGASGDLANLAHMALLLIGEGEALVDGQKMDGAKALQISGLEPVVPSGKDALAITNGTPIMASVGTLALLEAKYCLNAANAASTLTFEALHGFTNAYDQRIHNLRNQEGQIRVAAMLRSYLEGSEYVNTRHSDVQDPYTLRCIPQVHGASCDAIGYVENVLCRELNAVTDNPLVFTDTKEVISGGNFHGQPLALALDFLAIAVSELADISERRIERLVNPALSFGLPAFLIADGGLNSGLMIPQYVAAALVSENKVLSHPASVDSIPSSANKEDHVSMGAIAARKARSVIANVERVLAIELLAAAQALDLEEKHKLGKVTQDVYDFVRSKVEFIEKDKSTAKDIEVLAKAIKDGEFDAILGEENQL